MELKIIFYAGLVLCVIGFFEVLSTIRRNSTLKVYFLFIIASLFVMNYFSFEGISTRTELILVKSAKIIYACNTMLLTIKLVRSAIPKWINVFALFATIFLIGIRIYNFDRIDLETHLQQQSQIFTIGPELYAPMPLLTTIVLTIVAIVLILTFYYYRKFLLSIDKENEENRFLAGWMIAMIAPFFLLLVFGALGHFKLVQESISPYLFCFFSCSVISSILLRPKIIETGIFNSSISPRRLISIEPAVSDQ